MQNEDHQSAKEASYYGAESSIVESGTANVLFGGGQDEVDVDGNEGGRQDHSMND